MQGTRGVQGPHLGAVVEAAQRHPVATGGKRTPIGGNRQEIRRRTAIAPDAARRLDVPQLEAAAAHQQVRLTRGWEGQRRDLTHLGLQQVHIAPLGHIPDHHQPPWPPLGQQRAAGAEGEGRGLGRRHLGIDEPQQVARRTLPRLPQTHQRHAFHRHGHRQLPPVLGQGHPPGLQRGGVIHDGLGGERGAPRAIDDHRLAGAGGDVFVGGRDGTLHRESRVFSDTCGGIEQPQGLPLPHQHTRAAFDEAQRLAAALAGQPRRLEPDGQGVTVALERRATGGHERAAAGAQARLAPCAIAPCLAGLILAAGRRIPVAVGLTELAHRARAALGAWHTHIAAVLGAGGGILAALTGAVATRGVTGRAEHPLVGDAIEAARAGDAGKSFAVVATEVKSLAGQAERNTKELRTTVYEKIKVQTEGIAREFEKRDSGRLCEMAQNLVQLIVRNLYERTADCRWWATDEAFWKALQEVSPENTKHATKRLSQINRYYSVYMNLLLTDTNGTIIACSNSESYPRVLGSSVAGQKWFREAMNTFNGDQYAVDDIYNCHMHGDVPVCVYATAVRRGGQLNGRTVGTLGVYFNWPTESQTIVCEEPVLTKDEWKNIRVLLLDGNQRIIASSDGKGIYQKFNLVSKEQKGHYLSNDGSLIAFARTLGYQEYDGLGWYCVIVKRNTHQDISV